MPDKDGSLLPPIDDFDGDTQKVELKDNKCNHSFNYINPTEIRCVKCGVGYTGTSREISDLYSLFSQN